MDGVREAGDGEGKRRVGDRVVGTVESEVVDDAVGEEVVGLEEKVGNVVIAGEGGSPVVNDVGDDGVRVESGEEVGERVAEGEDGREEVGGEGEREDGEVLAAGGEVEGG